jgi:transposase
MRHIQGDSRDQLALLPQALDDLIAPDHLVRVIDAFVDGLALVELGFARAVAKQTGRKPYHPGDLLKLYLYGYLNQVQSSRRLERECQRNLELWWLLGRLAPDFKTIADFRRDNGAAIVASGRAFVVFCQGQGLLGQRLALDGTKIKSAGSRDRSFTAGQLADEQQRLEAYLSTLEQADAADTEAPVRAPSGCAPPSPSWPRPPRC